jgi:outer membrane cobalamin receptor
VEAGIQGGSRVRWSALAYRMRVDDEIDFDLRTFSYANIGQSRHAGIEIEGGGALWPRVQPSVTYAFTRVTDNNGGLQLKNIPRHVFSAGIHVDLPWKVAMSARYRYTAGAFFDDEDVYQIQGPSTLDVRVRHPLGRHAVFVDAVNLGNHHYQEYGFTLADFKGRRVPYAYPGAPRGIRVGINAAF